MKIGKSEVKIGQIFDRQIMPQIEDPIDFKRYLESKNVKTNKKMIGSDELRSSQLNFDRDKIESLIGNPSNKMIIVSNDDHVMDGHHRWIANQEMNRKNLVLKADLPILELIKAAKDYNQLQEQIHDHGELNHEKFGPMLDTFVQFASKKLGIKSMPSMRLEKEPMSSSFGGYNPAEKSIVVITKNRHPMDIYRTVAHELVHHKQNEDGRLGKDIRKEGATGSPIENEANAEAGKVMRWFAKVNPEMFKSGYVTEARIEEGLQDPAKGKAIFMAGGPGSGKDWIMKRTLEGHGLTEINSDNALEHLMRMRGLDPMMPKEEDYERNLARGTAKRITKEKERLALAGRRGVIINGTADDPKYIATIKKYLEDYGYETKLLFVNTNNEVSKQRNFERGLRGGRKVPDGTDKNGRPDGSPDIRGEKWEAAQAAKEPLKKLFGSEHFIHVDNSEDYRKVDDKRKKEIDKSHNQIFKHYRQFTSEPSKTEKSKAWIESEKKKRGITQYKPAKSVSVSQKKTVAPYEPSASEIEQAKRLGVQHIGGGQFGKDKEQISHITKNGQLTMIKEEKYKKIKACWKGYQAVGFKKKNGKRVPNCVPVDEDKDPCWKGYRQIGTKEKEGRKVPNCVPVDEAFEKMVKENTPSDREWGKTSTRKIYTKATPGQKKIAVEDNNIPPGSLPVQDGVGPEFTRRTSPSYIGFAGIQESVEKWVNDDKTQNRFFRKYGDLAEQKLLESAHKLNKLQFNQSGKKFFTHLREAWEAKGGRDMGTVPNTGKESFNEDENLDKVNRIAQELKDMVKKDKPAKMPHVNDLPDNLKQFKVDEDWQKVNRKDKTDGLSQKAVNAYRRENPGSKLQTAVTEKKPSGKRAKRRLSFCRRMSGMKKRLTSAKTARDPDSRINKALRRWNCEE
jgi:predicted kinase